MSAQERLTRIRRELEARFIERDRLVAGALIAVLVKEHMLMLGPPGTAKSMLAKEICARLGQSSYFEWLLTKFTTPEEIFGPISLPALESGRYERILAHKLPEARVAFLDEIFKANSAILNALLTILNERRFHNGTQTLSVPLESIFAASNELPEEDELGALYDRFLLRFTVGYIERDHHFLRLLALDDDDASARDATVLESGDLASLQEAVTRVAVPDTVREDILAVRRELEAEGVIASDRRYRQSLRVLRASAFLDGRDRVATRDLFWLEDVLWSDPDERAKVTKAVAKVASGFEEEARHLLAQAEEIAAYGRRPWPDPASRNRALIEAHTKLHTISQRIDAMLEASRARDRDTTSLDDISERITTMQKSLMATRN